MKPIVLSETSNLRSSGTPPTGLKLSTCAFDEFVSCLFRRSLSSFSEHSACTGSVPSPVGIVEPPTALGKTLARHSLRRGSSEHDWVAISRDHSVRPYPLSIFESPVLPTIDDPCLRTKIAATITPAFPMQHSERGEFHRTLPKPHHVRMLIIRNKYIHYQKIGSRQVRLSRPDLPDNLEVYIESLDGQGRITYISGYFEFNEAKLKFNAIGMEGYGGPNIGATLSEETFSALRQMGLDHDRIDELVTALQRKIMEGQVHIGLRDSSEPRNPDNKTDLQKS